MQQTHGRVVDVRDLHDLDRRLERGARSLAGWRITEVDLRERTDALAKVEVAQALFAGCALEPAAEVDVLRRGAVVIPDLPDVPVDVHRTTLYTPDELYDNASYPDSLDAVAYAWTWRPPTADSTLADALHDHALDSALAS